MLMEYLGNHNLESDLHLVRNLPTEPKLQLGFAIAEALMVFRRHPGFVHGDLSAMNIMLRPYSERCVTCRSP